MHGIIAILIGLGPALGLIGNVVQLDTTLIKTAPAIIGQVNAAKAQRCNCDRRLVMQVKATKHRRRSCSRK